MAPNAEFRQFLTKDLAEEAEAIGEALLRWDLPEDTLGVDNLPLDAPGCPMLDDIMVRDRELW